MGRQRSKRGESTYAIRVEADLDALGIMMRNKCGIDTRVICGTTKLAYSQGVSQPSRHSRKSAELSSWGRGRQEEQEHEIDRLAINCIKINRFPESSENSKRLSQALYPSMRNCHSTAYGRGSQFFTFENLGTDVISIQLEGACCPVAKLVEQPPLVLCANVNHRVSRGEEFLDLHRHSIPKLALFLVHISQGDRMR